MLEVRVFFFQIGRTENVQNSLNPDFAKSFTVDYMFEQVQKVKVAIYDIDNNTPKLSDDDFLGQVETSLGQVSSGEFLEQVFQVLSWWYCHEWGIADCWVQSNSVPSCL